MEILYIALLVLLATSLVILALAILVKIGTAGISSPVTLPVAIIASVIAFGISVLLFFLSFFFYPSFDNRYVPRHTISDDFGEPRVIPVGLIQTSTDNKSFTNRGDLEVNDTFHLRIQTAVESKS